MDEVPEMITRGALNVKMTYHRSNSSKEVKSMPQNIIFCNGLFYLKAIPLCQN